MWIVNWTPWFLDSPQNQLHTINQKIDQIIDKIEPRRKQFKNKTNQLTSDKQYSQEIENLWKDFKQLFDKNTGLNPDFSFNEMVIEIRQLLGLYMQPKLF